MKYVVFLIGAICLITSCTSDPCKDVICVNGNCVDGECQCSGSFIGPTCSELPCSNGAFINGKCDCNDGFYGELCDQSLFGSYHANTLSPVDCASDFGIKGIITNASDGERVCNIHNDGTQDCYWFRMVLDNDLTFAANLNLIDVDEDGRESLVAVFLFEGSFSHSEDMILVSTNDGTTYDLVFNDDKIMWDIPAGECHIRFEFDEL